MCIHIYHYVLIFYLFELAKIYKFNIINIIPISYNHTAKKHKPDKLIVHICSGQQIPRCKFYKDTRNLVKFLF